MSEPQLPERLRSLKDDDARHAPEPAQSVMKIGEGLWFDRRFPANRWVVRDSRPDVFYAERLLPPDESGLGDYHIIEARWARDRYVGAQRLRHTYRLIMPRVPGGFIIRSCVMSLGVQVIRLDDTRVTGWLESFDQRDAAIDPLTCRSWGSRFWVPMEWRRQ